MTAYLVKKSILNGTIRIPPSKSQTLRALLFGALARGKSVIHNVLPSPDAQAMIRACQLFGASFDVQWDRILVNGIDGKICFPSSQLKIDAGNSGLVLRFCSAIAALGNEPVIISGDHSIQYQRPMQPLIEGLSHLGVSTNCLQHLNYAPLMIQGPLRSGHAVIDGQDSQPVSALLIASAFAEGPIGLTVRNPGEKPWVALTLSWLDRLGISYEREGFHFYKMNGPHSCQGFEYSVPGDLSSAAFPVAAALVTQSDLTLQNVDFQDPQGDKALFNVFKEMGAQIEIDAQNKQLHVKQGQRLRGIDVDINDFVDAITILAVVACFTEGKTQIRNAEIARQKESNRLSCIVSELQKMGAHIQETEDGLIIHGSLLKGATVHSYQDHRMAMSLAVAGMGAEGLTQITSVDCVQKTFPSFAQDFKHLGADLERL